MSQKYWVDKTNPGDIRDNVSFGGIFRDAVIGG